MRIQNEKNNIEMIEFLLCNNHYGICTNLIQEIMACHPVTPVPNAHPSVEGIFMPRNKMITVIDLASCLQMGVGNDKGFYVVTQINGIEVAFHIDSVVGIHKIMCDEITDIGFSAPADGYTDGVVKKNGNLIILLNFENIVRDVNPENPECFM